MFGLIKNLYARWSSPQREAAASRATAAPPEAGPITTPDSAQLVSTPPSAVVGPSLALSLQAVIAKMPEALRTRVAKPPEPAVTISVPVSRILPQLAQGSVKITFGELRSLAPVDVFSKLSNLDSTPVELPLKDILPHLPRGQFSTRTGQKKVGLPADLPAVFTPKAAGIPTARAVATPEYRQSPSSTEVPAGSPIRPVAPKAAPTAPPAPRPSPFSPTPPAAKPAPPAKASTLPPPPAAEAKPQGAGSAVPLTAKAAPPPAPIIVGGMLVLPFMSAMEIWPEGARQVVRQVVPQETLVAIPVGELEVQLKRGRLVFSWQQIRSWLKPSLAPTAPSPLAEDTQLELPLKTVAPVFLAHYKPSAARRKVEIGENIPDVFAAKPSAISSAAPPKTAPTAPETATSAAPPTEVVAPPTAPAPVFAAAPGVAGLSRPEPPAAAPQAVAADDFIAQLGRRPLTPTELVQRTAALPGVAGALLCLADGLLVASQVPLGLNGDTIAAFVPQMFARMTQYAKELNLGEPKRLGLIIDDVPLQITKTGNLFFAVLGRAGEHLPQAHLTAVTAQLSR